MLAGAIVVSCSWDTIIIVINPDDLSGRPNQAAKQECTVSRSTADVQNTHTLANCRHQREAEE